MWLALGTSLFAACAGKPTSESKGRPGPVPVTLAPVVRKDVPVEIRVVGTAEAVSTVQVIPQVGGLVQEVHFREGDFVKKGALLFTIDTRPYQATLSAAQAELERSHVLAEQARQELARYEQLAAEGLATQMDLSQRRANAAALDAQLGANRAAIASSSINVQYAAIRSPIDGRTGSLLVQAGNVVRAADSRPLVTIRTIAPIYVRFAVPEHFLSEVRDTMRRGPVAVDASPRGSTAGVAHGTLTFIENAVDPASGKIDMKAAFGNDEQVLWPGQLTDVVVRLGVDRGALVVPESAVQMGQEGAYTFVVGPARKAELRRIETARTAGTDVVVSRGLAPGEAVVTDGQVRLRDGSAVRVAALPPAPSSPKPSLQPSAEPAASLPSAPGAGSSQNPSTGDEPAPGASAAPTPPARRSRRPQP